MTQPAHSTEVKVRFVRMSATKIRRIGRLVEGKSLSEAATVLKFLPQRAAPILLKAVNSAAANVQNNLQDDARQYVVKQVIVDEGPILKRIRPRAQGRAFQIRKRTSHVTVKLERMEK